MANKDMKKRAGIAVAAGVVVAGALGASAATLGSLNASNLGSAQAVVAACQEDGKVIDVTWGVADAAAGAKAKTTTNEVVVSNLSDTCKGGEYQLVVTGANDEALAVESGTVADTRFGHALSVPTQDITGVQLTINGGTARA